MPAARRRPDASRHRSLGATSSAARFSGWRRAVSTTATRPAEFADLDMRGRRIVLSTTNGTKALRRLAASPAVFVGALLNATAAVATLLAEARSRGTDAALVCSGLEAGNAFSLEDAFVAGALVENAIEQTRRTSGDLTLSDAAMAACRLYQSYQGDALACFREAEHGRSLTAIGLGRDLEFCARPTSMTSSRGCGATHRGACLWSSTGGRREG